MATRFLSDSDRILWNKVARTAKPLKGVSPLEPDPEVPPEPLAQMPDDVPVPRAPPPFAAPHKVVRHIDRPTHDKLAKGRLPIDAKIDLHGMTQARAHRALSGFLHRAHGDGLTFVLVITGKGKIGADSERGILRRQVPQWLSQPEFRTLVVGFEEAHIGHGGAGALYVRVRRRR